MNNKRVRLADIAELTVGYVGNMAKQYTDKGVKFLRSLNIKPFHIVEDDMKYISKEFCESLRKSTLHENDLIIVRTGLPGTCCVIPKEYDGCNCADVVLVKPNVDIVNPHYLAAYINMWGKKQVENNKVGAIQKHFNVESAEEMLIDLPDIEDQNKIAKVLCDINEKILNNEKINDYLEEIAKTIYDYWFMQFDFPNDCGMPCKPSGGCMDITNDNKNIPKTWKKLSISDICTLKNGINYEKDIKGDKDYTIVNVRDITASSLFIDNSSCDRISLPSILANKYLIPKDSILIARSGTPGSVRLVQGNDNNIIYCGFIIAVTPLDSRYKNYLAFTLKKYEGSNATQTGGSILKNVSQDTLNALTISYPPSDVVENFNTMVKPILQQIAANSDEISKLIHIRDWLLPMLMNGQATIKD